MENKSFKRGIKKRKKVLGKDYVDNTLKKTNEFNEEFQKFITEKCWDTLWNKKNLTDKQRSFNNLCILAATNKWNEFKLHLKGAINNDCSLAEIKEVFLQITLYCGIPTGNECFKTAEEVFLENKIVYNKKKKQ